MATVDYTVIYRVSGDKVKHNEWWATIRPLFMSDGEISIIGVAKSNALERVDELETKLEASGVKS